MSRARASRVQGGSTPLLCAARRGHLDVVRALLNAGADKTIANKYGDKPIDVARLLATTPTCSTRTRSSLFSAERRPLPLAGARGRRPLAARDRGERSDGGQREGE